MYLLMAFHQENLIGRYMLAMCRVFHTIRKYKIAYHTHDTNHEMYLQQIQANESMSAKIHLEAIK